MLIAIVESRFDWDKIIQNKYNTYEKVIFYCYVLYVITVSFYIVSTWIFPELVYPSGPITLNLIFRRASVGRVFGDNIQTRE